MKTAKSNKRHDDAITVSASEFKTRCSSLFDRLAARKLSRVIVTKRGKPVAEIVPPAQKVLDPWGVLRRTVTIAPGVDLTEPVLSDDEFDAVKGILHR